MDVSDTGQIWLLIRQRSEQRHEKSSLPITGTYPLLRVPLLVMTTPHRPARLRAPIALPSPASPDPEPQTQITASLGFVF